MPGLVPGIHVFTMQQLERRGWPGHRRAEATPSFGRLRPAMTKKRISQIRLRDLAARCARGLRLSLAQRGRGERRVPNAPAVSCAIIVVERTRVTTSTPESPGIPARNGFNGFLRALPGDRACLPPSPSGYVLSKPGRADLTSANLTPASGRQDHTTSPYASCISRPHAVDRSQAFRQPALQSRRAQNAAASTASLPASVTIMIRPSGGVGCENCRFDLGGVGTEIFFGKSEIRLDSPVN